MMRIRTGSRLHFGLLAPAAGAGRRFGGVGLMIDAPGIEITAEPADEWSVQGPLSSRADAVLRDLLAARSETGGPCLSFRVTRASPEHVGLGTGTQLSLTIARLLAEALGWEDRSAPTLAFLSGRGTRSALGIHGFEHGGFLVEGGKREANAIAPLVARLPFPEEWRIVLLLPRGSVGLHGKAERAVFDQIDAAEMHDADALCRLTLMGLLPALAERQFAEFSDSLYELNRRVGEMFRHAQGGTYFGPAAELVAEVRRLGIVGVGQSSWGPAVFAVAADEGQAVWLVEKLQQAADLPPADLLITTARNCGALVEHSI